MEPGERSSSGASKTSMVKRERIDKRDDKKILDDLLRDDVTLMFYMFSLIAGSQ